jgi:shikimate kinase
MWSGGLATPNEPARRLIVLTGFMGTGKSTVGRLVALRLGWNFVDTDAEIERRQRMPIAHIFRTQGEPAFRAMEAELAHELAQRTNTVIATGGGMLLNPANRAVLEAQAMLVCLTANERELDRRLKGSSHRPLAANWRAVYAGRRALYDSLPYHVDTSHRSPDASAREVIALWQQFANSGST